MRLSVFKYQCQFRPVPGPLKYIDIALSTVYSHLSNSDISFLGRNIGITIVHTCHSASGPSSEGRGYLMGQWFQIKKLALVWDWARDCWLFMGANTLSFLLLGLQILRGTVVGRTPLHLGNHAPLTVSITLSESNPICGPSTFPTVIIIVLSWLQAVKHHPISITWAHCSVDNNEPSLWHLPCQPWPAEESHPPLNFLVS